MRKYTQFFERYIGRSLHAWERRIIASLEYIRQHRTKHRVLIVDPPGIDSRELLCTYLRFIHDRIDGNIAALVMDRTRAQAQAVSAHRPSRDGRWLHTASGITPDHLRGLTFEYALLLNAGSYFKAGTRTPNLTARMNFLAVLRAVIPVATTGGTNFIIIHIRGCDPGVPSDYDTNPTCPVPTPPPRWASPAVHFIDPDASPEEIVEFVMSHQHPNHKQQTPQPKNQRRRRRKR